ncbi:site-specific recombinase XerD [Galbibacter orientalis DSM 19592]|uniref:Site-specific recombinase XerD n=1 Tax=Galbibacter orientalis DSM 19592 TaxID=926559 RepID=I3C285_9FLAO|nr:tyrosine-type recombinase/integrase [Galbibacter orientalis]EIJ37728.1 site-specific recombinase XerD [Galbibacter orientalis DSM 19592]
MKIVYTGIYASLIRDFIEFKQHCGFKYCTEQKILLQFDRLSRERNEDRLGIDSQLAHEWSLKRDNESDAYRYKRCITLNQFALHLNRKGITSVMAKAPKPKKNFTPHIYSRKELDNILVVCDGLECPTINRDSLYMVMPALIRFLLATGLRIGEALNLMIDDINLSDNYLTIRDTKNGKQRLLPFSESLATVLRQYLKHRYRFVSPNQAGFFFLTARGKKCKSEQIYRVFRKVLDRAGIPFKGAHYGPRVHDLRHTFAVKALENMVSNGMDIYCSLPILSTYLGHQSLDATNQYVRLTAEQHPGLIRDYEDIFINVFPSLEKL